jgi:hypothetical protein
MLATRGRPKRHRLQWGSAVDGTRVYTANANSESKAWALLPNNGPTVIYRGSGYSNFGFGTPNNELYAFSIDGK